MYKEKTISVAMATYNGEKYIREQLESILNQTVVPDEIVISDDGSTDRTVEIAHDIAQSCQANIKIYTDNPRHGFAFNFGYAISHCSGSILFMCDQDDIWDPRKVEHIVDVYCQYPDALCVFHNAVSVDSDGKPSQKLFNEYVQKLSDEHCIGEIAKVPGDPNCEVAASAPLINGMIMSVSRKLLDTALPFPPISSQHDGWLWFCAEAQDCCYFRNEVLTFRRLHNENTSGAGRQGFGRKRIKKILRNITKHSDVARTRIVYAKFMLEYTQTHCAEDNSGVKRAIPTIARTWEIGQKEIAAAKSSRIIGAVKLIKLFITDMRYRRCGTKVFLYELTDIVIHSRKSRTRKLREMQL